ncbi:unnamed protein product [Rhizoctonia solani]|uniref:Uncharacterized protein n=1 Tax=Rhizoctonia solani TaxID=456999 RepID=A0A8H3C9D2_9AGAM|nr:unnamed protein product [Rhizoctonia solani]
MEGLCSGHIRANRLSALAQAADYLAKAAVTLSEAARAAAETFSSELLDTSSEAEHISDDNDEEPAGSTLVQPTNNEAAAAVIEPCSAGPMAIDQLRFDPNQPLPVASVTTEVETVAGLAYRLLVEHESDVLLFVCALIRNRRKVICYMNCSVPAFHMYKKFINDVTGTTVYTITKISTAEITKVGQKFLEADHSILLLPETTTPSIEIDDVDSWVIHVGWPSDEQRYEEQRLIHQAQNSIMVACSGDEELYPAGASIMWQSRPWPGDVDSFRVSVALLRPIFDQKLASLPAEMKAKVYPDWISCHGSRGHRYVKSWDAATLVTKANSFLLDVLKYQAPSLPEVSEGFMAHNGLELAEKEGVLRVKVPNSGINHVSSLPKNDWAPSNSECPLAVDPSPSLGPMNGPPSVGLGSTQNAFKPTPGNTYLTINDEFEAIPLMCFLAGTCAHVSRKVVFFFDTSGCQLQYQKLIARITEWTVFAPDITETIQSTEDAALKFAKFQGPAILLLPFKVQTPPSALINVSLGYCVYWGSTLGGVHPSSADLLHRDDSSWLSDSRRKTRLVLSGNPELVKELYEAQLRSLGRTSRGVLGAEEIANRINKFTANVLLAGNPEDGSKKYPPIAARLVTPLSIVSEFKLQAAAATALAEAAEAVAAAAKSLISDISDTSSVSQPAKNLEKSRGIDITVEYESHTGSSSTTEVLTTPTNDTNNAQGELNDTQSVSGSGREKYFNAQSTTQGMHSNNSLADISIIQQTKSEETLKPEIRAQPLPPSYHILLENEADVLLAACALIRPGGKFVCYVRSALRTLPIYQTILSITGVPVHAIKSFSSHDLERAVKSFQGDLNSVLLLPAKTPQGFEIGEQNSWVIHVGWPANEQLYKQQIIQHQAKNNVFIAYAGDKDVYPSSVEILMHAQPWSKDEFAFKTACMTLRPLFDKKLDEIPAKIKAKIYPDWIYTHGPNGAYGPPSWTPTTYNTTTCDSQSGEKIDLPEVTAGLVTSQKLESAVEEGVLRVKPTSGLNHISSLPDTDTIPTGAIYLDEQESSTSLGGYDPNQATQFASPSTPPRPTFNQDRESNNLHTLKPNHIPPRPASRIGCSADSIGSAPSGHETKPPSPRVTEYLIVEADLDLIPTICYLSTRPNSENAICFVKCLGTFEPIAKMLEQMVMKPVFYVKASDFLSANIKTALGSTTGCLVFCSMYNERPPCLKSAPIGVTVHLGWIDNLPTYYSQVQQQTNTVVFLRRETQSSDWSEMSASLDRAGVVPVSTSTKRLYNRQTETSILRPGRNKWKELLTTSASTSSIRSSYMGWIIHHYTGRHKEPEWTAANVATHANNYFKRIFCCGSGGDAYQDRPLVTQGFVKHLGLEAAVAAGLLTVKAQLG